MGLSDIKLTDIDFESVEACTQPRVLRKYIQLLVEDGGYFHQLLHVAREKLAALTGCKTGCSAKRNDGGASAAEIAAARQDLLQWQCSLKKSSELTSENEIQKKLGDDSVKFVSERIEELENVAPDVEEATHANFKDGKEVGSNQRAKPLSRNQAEPGKEKPETGKDGEKGNDEKVGSNHGDVKEKSRKGHGEYEIASGGDIGKQGEQTKYIEEAKRVKNSGGGQKAGGRNPSQCQDKGDTKLSEARLLEEKNLLLVSNATEVGNRIEVLSSDEDEGRPSTARKHVCLPTGKRPSDVGDDERAERGAFTGRSTAEQENKERQTEINALQCASESPSYSIKRQMRKICVLVDEEDDTEDECSDISNSDAE